MFQPAELDILLSSSFSKSSIIQSSYLQTFLSFFIPILTSAQKSPPSTEHSPCGTCIQDNEVLAIAQRWLDAFATGGLHTLDLAVTENVRQDISPFIARDS